MEFHSTCTASQLLWVVGICVPTQQMSKLRELNHWFQVTRGYTPKSALIQSLWASPLYTYCLCSSDTGTRSPPSLRLKLWSGSSISSYPVSSLLVLPFQRLSNLCLDLHLSPFHSSQEHFCLFVCLRFIYLRDKAQGQGQKRERILRLVTEHEAPMEGSVPTPWDHDLGRNKGSDIQPTEPPRHPQPGLFKESLNDFGLSSAMSDFFFFFLTWKLS